ncbi:MAG: M48 family metalloprotease [Ignavibacteriales bacterium]|nr:M48 family metalloprotease [Ignavibacteriales bacterium]
MIKRIGNIYEQQEKNDWLTVLLVVIFILYYLIIGYGTDVFMFGNDLFGLVHPASEKPPYATIVALLFSGAYVIYVLYRGDNIILKSVSMARVWNYDEMMGGKIIENIERDDAANKPIVNLVHEMSLAAGVTMPAIYIVYDTDPNAFSTGRDPWHASIALTTGLLKKLNRAELQAVIAHEMAHIRNYDTRLMMLMATLIGGSTLLSAYAGGRWIQSIGMVRKVLLIGRATVFFPLWVGMVVIAPLVSWFMTILVSHTREYQADATAAELTRNPRAMLSALEKLEMFSGATRSINSSICHLCVIDPMGKYMQIEDESIFQGALFDTHPPMEKRLAALKEMAFLYQATGKFVLDESLSSRK